MLLILTINNALIKMTFSCGNLFIYVCTRTAAPLSIDEDAAAANNSDDDDKIWFCKITIPIH